MGLRIEAHRGEVLGEHARGLRIVRDVQNNRRSTRKYLEPRGKLNMRKAVSNVLYADREARAQRIERGKRRAGVRKLALASERWRCEAASAYAPSPKHPLLPLFPIAEIAADQPKVDTRCARVVENAARRIPIRDYRGFTPTENPRLFVPDAFARVAEVIRVIQTDRGQQRAVGIEGVDRVQAPTQADLQYHGVERLRRKNLPRSQGTELEIRERDLTASALDRFEGRTQACVAQGHTVEANALVVTKEVRRSVKTHSISGGEKKRFQHRAGRAQIGRASCRE